MSATAARAALGAALLALAACSGGSVGPTPPPPPQCKGYDQSCGVGSECCSGECPLGACGCSAVSERCGTSNDCCTSLGPARCDAGVCASGQRAIGDVCTGDGECASLNCDIGGHCAARCAQYGATCTSSAQCCGYLGCPAGTCSLDCGSDYHACTSDNECCADYRCRGGECQRGLCGTAFQRCASEADCCTVAQGGKEYFCNEGGSCDIGQPYDMPGWPPDACATDADCADDYPCRGGYCHWPDGHQADGHWCLDGQECDSGICTSTAAGVPGTCCSGAGTACSALSTATICCAGQDLACTGLAGAQSCGSCLDFGNSGPQGTAETQCTGSGQCCTGRNLTCVLGECCTQRGYACTPGTGATECCSGDTCGDVTSYDGTKTQCCGDYGASGCGLYSACCDGLLCASGACLKGPGLTCSGSGQCAEDKGVGCNLSTGTCCSHADGPCDADADCCTNSCDATNHRCRAVPEYGSCLSEIDCFGPDYNQGWSGQVCGGNANLGAGVCCPVPGDTCRSQADCCETSDLCQVPHYVNPYGSNPDPASPRCCRPANTEASQGYECCTGMAERRSSTSIVEYCCGYPWMTTFTCTSNDDCCGATAYAASTKCNAGVTDRCCFIDSRSCPGTTADAAALCCSGKVDPTGCCRSN